MEPEEVDQALQGRISTRLGTTVAAGLGQQAFHLSLSLYQGCVLLVPVLYTVGCEAPKEAAWGPPVAAALQGLFRDLGRPAQVVTPGGGGTSGLSSSSPALEADVEGQRLHLALTGERATAGLLPVAWLAGHSSTPLEVLAATGGGWVVSVPQRLPEGSVLHVAVGLAEQGDEAGSSRGGVSQVSKPLDAGRLLCLLACSLAGLPAAWARVQRPLQGSSPLV